MVISLNIDDGLRQRFEKLAATLEQSTDDVMGEALRQFIEREEAALSFHQEALESLREHEETGEHLTGEETRAWLERWETDGPVSPPPCHK